MNIAECVRSHRRGKSIRGLTSTDKARLVELIQNQPDSSSHDIARAYIVTAPKARPKPTAKPEAMPKYEDMTIKALYKLAKGLGIKGVTNRTKKASLIKKLRN